MNFINTITTRNKALTYAGYFFLIHSLIVAAIIPFNTIEVLGINSLFKPLKFSVSIWIFCWTMAYLVHYFEDKVLVRRLSVLAIVTMLYEQAVITVQALRGTLSHFNDKTPLEFALFGLMGVMITAMTLYLAFANFKFWRQQDNLSKTLKASIIWGINIFVISGLMGGVMGAHSSHNVGGAMGGKSMAVTNWSLEYGDLRVGHFIGLHALQVLPFLGFWIKESFKEAMALPLMRALCLFYATFVAFTFGQALMGLPFIS